MSPSSLCEQADGTPNACNHQVLLNQIALAPVVLVVVFAWNLALTGQSHAIPQKIEKDLVPTMINGMLFQAVELCVGGPSNLAATRSTALLPGLQKA